MDKELLVTDTLSEQMIAAGAKLVERLDALQSDVKGALWIYFPEDKAWKLILASPFVKGEGPKRYYKRIIEANKKAAVDENVISLNDIGVSNIDYKLVQLLKIAISTGDDISGIRFSRNTINGFFIDDAYIYRMNLST